MTHCAHDGTRRDDESDGYLEWVEAFMETDPGDRHQVGLIVRDLLARVRRRDRTTSNVAALSARVVEAAVELRDMHERVRSALRAMYAYIQGPCDCGVCAAVDAYLAALEGR